MKALQGLPALLADPLLSDVLQGRRDGLLVLDYDGTLAPFVAQRDKAWPHEGVVELLARLPARGPGRFVVVSGREAREILRLLHPARPLEVWGCHGAERLSPGQPPRIRDLTARWERALAEALELAARTAPPGSLEPKPVSLALHWRGLAADRRHALRRDIGRAWARLARETGLALRAFDGGLELRPPGMDKGLAVRVLRRENPGTSLVYCGDDLTDEDAFQVLGPSDIGVLVRALPRATAARHRIVPPGELLRFLTLWADAAGTGETRTGGSYAS